MQILARVFIALTAFLTKLGFSFRLSISAIICLLSSFKSGGGLEFTRFLMCPHNTLKSGDLGGYSLSLKRATNLFWKTLLTLSLSIIIWCTGAPSCAQHIFWNCPSWNWCENNKTNKKKIAMFITSKYEFPVTLPPKKKDPSIGTLPHNATQTVSF